MDVGMIINDCKHTEKIYIPESVYLLRKYIIYKVVLPSQSKK